MRGGAYHSASAKADEASKSLRNEQTLVAKLDDDDEEEFKSLDRARRGKASGALAYDSTGDLQKNKIVFTEMETFVRGLQLDQGPRASDQERQDETGTWTEVKDPAKFEENIVPNGTIHIVPIGKGLCGALKLLKDRGTPKESVELGGRNMDKNQKFKEDFRMLCHKFHGKYPGKRKQEKRIKQYQKELKLKRMKNSDKPSASAERMREVLCSAKDALPCPQWT